MLEKIADFLWGYPALIMILTAGLFFSIKNKFYQLHFSEIFKATVKSLFIKKNKNSDKNTINQLQTISVALAATMGTGNIIGVAGALMIGGAGAIFWMWASAFLGMMLVYAENFLSIRFRRKNAQGEQIGGAFAYMTYGLKNRALAVFFGICCILTSFGMGCTAQTNSAAQSLEGLGINKGVTGGVTAFFLAVILVGGIKRIGNISAIIIPFLSIGYIVCALVVIIFHYQNIIPVLTNIFKSAFGLSEVTGGLTGYTVSRAINIGLRRGVFSNEAGLGTSALMHKDVASDNPKLQGQWGIAEIFIDTVICCTLTALVILTSNISGSTESELVTSAFATVMGDFAKPFIGISVALFAFSTLISWGYCGESAFKFVFGNKHSDIYKIIFVLTAFAGAILNTAQIWVISDIFNVLMLIPNIFALVFLHKELKSTGQDKHNML